MDNIDSNIDNINDIKINKTNNEIINEDDNKIRDELFNDNKNIDNNKIHNK